MSESSNAQGGGGPTGPSSGVGGGVPGPENPGGIQDLEEEAGTPPDEGYFALCDDSWIVQNVFAMSADDSNSMASPGYSREMLMEGLAPEPALIRTHEFLNYYNAGYAPSMDGDLAVYAHMQKGIAPGDHRLQIGVAAPPPASLRRSMTLTLVIDTSQSMMGKGITNARAVVREIAQSLRDGDRVSVLTLDSKATPILAGLEIKSPADIEAVAGTADALNAGGAADLQGGLVHGYSLAHTHITTAGINRLVLVTDGRANPTTINPTFIAEHAKQGEDHGIYLVGVGTGPADGYNDALLNQLTDYGRGAYVYIDTEAEAKNVFSGRFSEVMDVAARNVAVQLKVPSYLRLQTFYGESFELAASAIEPQHLAPGDAMVFNMTLTACASAPIPGTDSIEVMVSWTTPVEGTPQFVGPTIPIETIMGGDDGPMLKSNAVIAYAEALKSLDGKRLQEAHNTVDMALNGPVGPDPDLVEIKALIELHPAWPAP